MLGAHAKQHMNVLQPVLGLTICYLGASCRALQMLGADVAGPDKVAFNGLHLELWPRITWSPLFALTFDDLRVRSMIDE